MRISRWMAGPALGSLMLMAACGPGYGRGGVVVGAQLGPGLDVYGYNSTYHGDWRASYQQWTPTTVYESNGQYYPNSVNGARQVQVYHSQAGYFLPPREQGFAGTDKRLNSKQAPNEADYGRARPRP